MRAHFHRNRALLERAFLAFILPGVAGAINASGFFAIGTYTAHVTGNVARIGDELAAGHLWLAARASIFVLSFGFGAMISTFLVLYGKRAGGPPYWRPLLLECGLVFVFATVSVNAEHRAHINSLAMTALLCVAMGLQNALVTKLSGARVRNTHLTGITTDLAIESARVIDAWQQGRKGQTVEVAPDVRKLRLHAAILLSFLAGAMLGPIFYMAVGHVAMLVPCALLLGLAAFDAWMGFSGQALEPSSSSLFTNLPTHRVAD
jgi:uncharacterized membrane protein YoaK (UPF0700 family)